MDAQKCELQKNFIEYWDKVIDIWLGKNQGGISVHADRKSDASTPGKYPFYKDTRLYVDIEIGQYPFFYNEKLRDLLCPAHMPEPYWGNPCECSIVIINYNPGGGTDMNPHTYKFTNGAPHPTSFPPNTLIEFVNRNCYSQLALDFPLWNSDAPNWIRSYGGYGWWQQKKKWIGHLVKDSVNTDINTDINTEEVRPFAIELCGWHSKKWSQDVFKNIDPELQCSIKKHFILPLLKAIENSKTNIAVCIGAQFSLENLRLFINDGIEDKTKDIFDKFDDSAEQIEEKRYLNGPRQGHDSIKVTYNKKSKKFNVEYPKNPKKNKNIEDDSSKPKDKDERTRYYRVYNIKYDGKDHLILNTYAPGGNHHPADYFWAFEKLLLK